MAFFGIDAELSYLAKVVQSFRRRASHLWHVYGPAGTDRLVRILPEKATLKIREADEGSLEFDFRVLNLTRREVEFGDVQIRTVGIGRGSVREPRVFFRGRGTTLSPRDSSYLGLKFALTAKDVREMFRVLDEANNLYSTPGTRVEVKGKLQLWIGRKKEWRSLDLRVPHVHRSITSPERLEIDV